MLSITARASPSSVSILRGRDDILERARRFELVHEFVDVFGPAAEHRHRDVRHAILERWPHGRQHHIRRQGRFNLVEELRPRERALIDQRVGFLGRADDERAVRPC